MSALGQKQTCAAQKVMSALPLKADMCGATRHVRFVPIADLVLGRPLLSKSGQTPAGRSTEQAAITRYFKAKMFEIFSRLAISLAV
jgi:hypothetical protein